VKSAKLDGKKLSFDAEMKGRKVGIEAEEPVRISAMKLLEW